MFSKGDQVVERGSMSCVGTVVSGPEMHAGEAYYRVNFNGRIKNVVEEDLEHFAGEQVQTEWSFCSRSLPPGMKANRQETL
jgi:hypothetical protein